jgi:hypothetical protein
MFDVCVQLYFKLEDEQDLMQAARQHDLVCVDRLKDMYHEARTQAIISYYANVKNDRVNKGTSQGDGMSRGDQPYRGAVHAGN